MQFCVKVQNVHHVFKKTFCNSILGLVTYYKKRYIRKQPVNSLSLNTGSKILERKILVVKCLTHTTTFVCYMQHYIFYCKTQYPIPLLPICPLKSEFLGTTVGRCDSASMPFTMNSYWTSSEFLIGFYLLLLFLANRICRHFTFRNQALHLCLLICSMKKFCDCSKMKFLTRVDFLLKSKITELYFKMQFYWSYKWLNIK